MRWNPRRQRAAAEASRRQADGASCEPLFLSPEPLARERHTQQYEEERYVPQLLLFDEGGFALDVLRVFGHIAEFRKWIVSAAGRCSDGLEEPGVECSIVVLDGTIVDLE